MLRPSYRVAGSAIFAACTFAFALAPASGTKPLATADSVTAAPHTPSPQEDIDASHGMPLVPRLPLYLHVQPRVPPPPAFTDDQEHRMVASLAEPESGGDDEFRPEAPETSIELALAPRVWVHPRIPREAAKRRIDDAVVLQCLLDASGHVQRVRVLRGIPNCHECTTNARLAAQQFVYNAPPRPPHIREVWTTPFKIQFTAGQRPRYRR